MDLSNRIGLYQILSTAATRYDGPDAALEARFENHKLWLDSKGKNGERFRARENEVFSGFNLSDLDLRKAILSGATFDSCSMFDTNLSQADAQGTIWIKSLLRRTKFNGTNIEGARFEGCEYERKQFRHASGKSNVFWTAEEIREAEKKNEDAAALQLNHS
ncbi:MAG: pentapeptide repeat-containing protein [Alphaproteobacteria bacterium]